MTDFPNSGGVTPHGEYPKTGWTREAWRAYLRHFRDVARLDSVRDKYADWLRKLETQSGGAERP